MPTSAKPMHNPLHFSRETFRYFDGAKKQATGRAWFETHRELYAKAVEVPLTHLVTELREALAPALPGFVFSAKKISRPVLRKSQDKEGPVLRENATAYFSEAATSMFEMNPGIYLSIGAKDDDNVIGCGIYMPSARQLRELRSRFPGQAPVLQGILEAEPLQKFWSGLSGEQYKRFPKGLDETMRGAQYLWHKQFFLGKQFSRAEVAAPDFIDNAVRSLSAALPFLIWTRTAVGVYRKPKPNEDKA